MHSELLLKAFEKIEGEFPHLAKTKQADKLSDLIEELSTESGRMEVIGGKRLMQLKVQATDVSITLRSGIDDALARYLGYQNYLEFVKTKIEQQQPVKYRIGRFFKKHRVVLMVAVLGMAGYIWAWSVPRREWMKWSGNHYEKVEFNKDDYNLGLLKIYDEETESRFLKIKPDCHTKFFTGTHKPLIFYGKNRDRKYEFFTEYGNHPETDKPLKPITDYMIQKYICPEWH